MRSLRLDRGNLRTLVVLAACIVGEPTALSLAMGWAVLAAGAALHLWAKGTLRQNRALATSGPYRYTRNPFYLGNLLIDSGIALSAAEPWLLAGLLPVWGLVYHRTIAGEERRLDELFGDAFRRYRAAVPRLLPAPPRRDLALPLSPGFSWQNPNLAAGREYARLVRAFGAPLLVWAVSEVWEDRLGILTDNWSLELAALALLVGAKALERALALRFKGGPFLPPAVQTPWARALALAGFGALLFHAHWFETERDALVYPVGFAAALALAFALGRASRAGPAAQRAFEACVCLTGGWLAELPWLGVLGASGFAVLAVDAIGGVRTPPRPATAARPRPWLPAALPRLLAPLALLLFVGLAIAKELSDRDAVPLFF